jgi:hypothetical protein
MKRIIGTLILAATVASATAGDSKFIQLSLTPDIALQSRDTTIEGICLNIWGENEQSSFTLGFVNGSTGKSAGFSWGLVNYAESYTGVQFGFVNCSSEKFVGWQNGVVNVGREVHGLQWGAVNYAETLSGVQLGFVNIVKDNPWFDDFPDKLAKAFVFLNWSF